MRQERTTLERIKTEMDKRRVVKVKYGDCWECRENWAPTAKQWVYWFRLNGKVVGHTTGEYLAERQLLARLMAFAELYKDYTK